MDAIYCQYSLPQWLRNLTAREIINALARDDFTFYNQRGLHQRYRHADGCRVTVTYHRAGDTFALGTLRSVIETQAKWSVEDLQRLGLL